MIDTHAHLDFQEFEEDREEVISRSFDNGLHAIINVGVDLPTSKKSIELAEVHKNIFATVGFHPHDAQETLSSSYEEDFDELKKIAAHEKVVAIGEIGLDYLRFKDASQIENQKKLFLHQLDIAMEMNLPVVIHCREAWSDLYEIISKGIFQKLVLHCYSGDRHDTEKFLKIPNVNFSFSGNITYPKPKERNGVLTEAIRMIPLDKIMLDSDSPFLAPQEKRGKRNEPINVIYIAKYIAGVKNVSFSEVEKISDRNAIKFFDLP